MAFGLKRWIRPLVPPRAWRAASRYRRLPEQLGEIERRLTALEAGSPVGASSGEGPSPSQPSLRSPSNEYERRVYSQNGEDGILEFIFQRIGTTDRRFVEIGVGDGRQCNTALLSLERDWTGLLIELDASAVERARAYYHDRLAEAAGVVQIVACRVTPEAINQVLSQHGLTGPIDLLSIDIDGNDYWVWEAIEVIRPRVVVIEYNASFGAERSISVAYDPKFERFAKHPSGIYHGASLRALTRLGHRRGYLLVGCESTGVNAFYVLESAAAGLSEIPVEQALYPNLHHARTLTTEEQFQVVAHLELVEV